MLTVGGFFAPAALGYLQQHTGLISGGLYELGIAPIIVAVVAFFAKDRLVSRAEPAAVANPTRAL
jgi:nitrate/nitrite transporter NarK